MNTSFTLLSKIDNKASVKQKYLKNCLVYSTYMLNDLFKCYELDRAIS